MRPDIRPTPLATNDDQRTSEVERTARKQRPFHSNVCVCAHAS